MSDEEKKEETPKEESKKFVKVTVQQIIGAVVSVILLGALGFIGTMVSRSIDTSTQNKEDIRVNNTILETDLTNKLDNIEEAITEYSTKMGSSDANIRRLELALIRLETIVDRMEGD